MELHWAQDGWGVVHLYEGDFRRATVTRTAIGSQDDDNQYYWTINRRKRRATIIDSGYTTTLEEAKAVVVALVRLGQ